MAAAAAAGALFHLDRAGGGGGEGRRGQETTETEAADPRPGARWAAGNCFRRGSNAQKPFRLAGPIAPVQGRERGGRERWKEGRKERGEDGEKGRTGVPPFASFCE